jgi:iron complex transport system ATP-binding protein
MSLLHATRLDVSIAGHAVCHQLELRIEPGDRWCLLGRNGAGKTTLLHTLAGLRRAAGGQVTVAGDLLETLPHRKRAQRIGLLPQDHQDAFPATVLETALAGRHPWLGAWQWEGAADRCLAQDALAAVGLAGFEDRNIATLSGGERRRLGIATLLTQQTPLLLLDEPVNHLDIHQQVRMLELLVSQTTDAQRATLMVMHDLNLAARYCTKFLLLFGDGAHAQGSPEVALRTENLTRLYQHPLTRIETACGPVWIPAQGEARTGIS